MLDSSRLKSIRGFGQPEGVGAYVFEPETTTDILELYDLARAQGVGLSFAGARRSYGSPMMTPGGIVVSLRKFKQLGPIEEGSIQVGGGVTLDELWRHVAPQGYWPKVVSGTSKVTIAGAIAMDIHGKNAFKVGNIGEHVQNIELVAPQSASHSRDAIGSMGLFGAITSATIGLQKIASSSLSVKAAAPTSWTEHLSLFLDHETSSDYMVGWVDMASQAGRGVFHAACYDPDGASLEARQLKASPLFGIVPRDQAWRVLRLLNRPTLSKMVNAAKFNSAKWFTGRQHRQSLAEFSFLLDSLPNWERAYARGLLQFQAFVPRAAAASVFPELQSLQRRSRIISTLGVLKRHRESAQVLPYALDGFSLAMDFARQDGLSELCDAMAEVVINAGGRFYLAKDSTLTADQYARSLPAGAMEEFRRLKQAYDPENLIQSIQSRHLGLT